MAFAYTRELPGAARHPLDVAGWVRKLTWVMICWAGLIGCSKSTPDNDYLIKVGGGTVTVVEFKRAVEAAAEDVFIGEQEISADARNDLRMRVLNQLTEEMLITERAKTLGLSVDTEELDKAVAEIKADYPDDTFEKTLLENAVSFQAWKKKLGTRILINKVIEQELVDKVEITPQDVTDYFQVHYPQGVQEGENADEINQKIVHHLRQQKAEEMYQQWIENLKKSYPVDINQECWNRLASAD